LGEIAFGDKSTSAITAKCLAFLVEITVAPVAFAEFVTVPERIVHQLPESLGFPEARCLKHLKNNLWRFMQLRFPR